MRSLLSIVLVFGLAASAVARDPAGASRPSAAAVSPNYCTATHSVGKLGLIVANGGFWGSPLGGTPYVSDSSGCHLGSLALEPPIRADEYPLGSGDSYLRSAAVWVGAVTETGDTLVSVGYAPVWDGGLRANLELQPDAAPFGEILARSIDDDAFLSEARSEQDYVAVCSDTLTRTPGLARDFLSGQWHRPLGIEVVQTSMQWSNSLVDDFVLVEYRITNIGRQTLRACYAGLLVDPAAGHLASFGNDTSLGVAGSDDVCGRLEVFPAARGCGFVDTLDIAWNADHDGDPAPQTYQWVYSGEHRSIFGVAGLRVLRAPEGSRQSYNWWVQKAWNLGPGVDWGPRHKAAPGFEPRNFGTGGTGEPEGDANKYYLMSNGETDPDQPRMAEIDLSDPVWEPPAEFVHAWAYTAAESNYLVSVGPFDLARGESETFVVAYVAGGNFHADPRNGLRLYPDRDVDGWYASVDFSELARNAKMAEWVFDNPGFDTDGDGYAGKTRVCVLDSVLVGGDWIPSAAETTYYAGDGVPDWRAVGPPPAPKTWLASTFNGVKIRFNGQRSETTKDLVSNQIDFEGYNVYLGRDDREASLSLAASFDRANYDKLVLAFGEWRVGDVPYSLDELRCRYGLAADPCSDSSFDPLTYTMASPLRLRGFESDSVFAFARHGYNGGLSSSGIRKTYPDVPEPVPGEELPPDQVTADGYPKYYEYECTLENLLPTVPYYVNVTAFDFGDPASGVEALESSKLVKLQSAYAFADANQTGDSLAPAYVYPNPYYGDGRYALEGFEDRYKRGANPDRERLIHFVNVPARCIIRIHTLDGDLVRAINHDVDPSDPNSYHETWDLINRNIQTVESGLYFWSVEDASGRVQLGKLVIIR